MNLTFAHAGKFGQILCYTCEVVRMVPDHHDAPCFGQRVEWSRYGCNGIATGSARADMRDIKMPDQRRAHSAFKVLFFRKLLFDVMLACCTCRYNKLIR